ncbi:MAG: hypothetical protein DRG11_05195 [Epsilonproteobacteria bacterium]|nr:MAG: hypothetical protein DRG11_05195 [Campylobacterota bacterium]
MKILDWRNHNQRINITNSFISSKVLRDISCSGAEYFYADDLSWLPNDFDKILFRKNFLKLYKGIKCFHACSPVNIDNYLINGFTGGNHEKAIAIFNKIFSDIPDEYRKKAIVEISRSREDEALKTFFLCDSKCLINKDGHYLIYGSEYLIVLAANLSAQKISTEYFRQRLKGIGIPTIIEADIDFSLLDNKQIDYLIDYSLSDWANYNIFNSQFTPSEMSIIAKQKLPSSVIINHWHPEKIHDPFNWGKWYSPDKTTCSSC